MYAAWLYDFFVASGLSFLLLYVQDGQTALVIASKEGRDQIVELLLRRDANVNHQTKVRLLMFRVCILHNSVPLCGRIKEAVYTLRKHDPILPEDHPLNRCEGCFKWV